ncbi:NlpC/P60 family protein [Thermoanaerobacterium sp. CMT5567-10]|uniref:NlpC/P60 family protein n=1 Tax=Thermoanaerobacterium sp. CMT5567-10 TaxID=3061989 RepID=UPI0037DC1996
MKINNVETLLIKAPVKKPFKTSFERYIKPTIMGMDILDFDNLMLKLDKSILHNSSAKAACDIAIYDILGQYYKTPLYRYLGVVTGNHIRTQFNPFDKDISELEFDMGTRIPLENNKLVSIGNQNTFGNHVVKLPTKDVNGNLVFKDALVSTLQDINRGYLPYTRANILRQAFKLLGDRYGWGDSFNGRDCSSFIMYVYKTFGFRLPKERR